MWKLAFPREKLAWFPWINYDICLSDLECLNYCQYDVFEWETPTGRPIVAHPYSCLPGCDDCAQRCKAQAISLPSKEELLTALNKFRSETRIDSPPGRIS
jgi:NAD-dependent dihydropyrimidine dehydrogenase PreA subunit